MVTVAPETGAAKTEPLTVIDEEAELFDELPHPTSNARTLKLSKLHILNLADNMAVPP